MVLPPWRIALFLTLMIAMAGCNGLASDRPTISVTPVPVTDVTPKEGFLLLENNRSEAYRVTVSVFDDRPTDVTFTYANGTNRTTDLTYEPIPRVNMHRGRIPLASLGTLTDDITEVQPGQAPVWQRELPLPAVNRELLRLPEARGSYALFVEVKSVDMDEITSLYVLACDGVADKPRVQLEAFGESSWGGC